MLVECEHPIAGQVRTVGTPVMLSDTPGRVREPAPVRGLHPGEILREWPGLDAAEIVRLRAAGAIGGSR
jgi:crotonobetainyl-CoA:carnitine CoA-transferase CaiB-like acyl-CoA transferase